MDSVRPQVIGLLALLALVPVTYYLVNTDQLIVWASLVCVLLIAGSLYWLFQPTDRTPVDH